MRSRILALAIVAALAACDNELTTSGPVNHAPVFRDIPDTSVILGTTLGLTFSATDEDGDSLSYELTNIVSFQEFREGYEPDSEILPELGVFRFTPIERDAPVRSFRITARDGRGKADSTTFNVGVE